MVIGHALRRIEIALAVRAERDRQARDDTARQSIKVVKADANRDHEGSTILRCAATSLMWAMRDGGMPALRQWLTVDGEASRASASLVIPPKALTTKSYCVSIFDGMR